MTLDGKAVAYVFDLNSLGQLLFGVEFIDGTTALVLAQVPEPTSLALLAGGTPLLSTRRRG